MKFSFLIASLFNLSAMAAEAPLNVIDIYVAPSAAPIDWTSPKSLYSSVMKSIRTSNEYQTGFGHGLVVANCETKEGTRFQTSTSMGGNNYTLNTKISILLKQEGLQVLFADLTKGFLYDSTTNNHFIHYMHRIENNLNGTKSYPQSRVLRIHVSPEKCSEAQKYHDAVRDNKYLTFGFESDPYQQYVKKAEKIGAGCTSFVSGFIKVLGVWDQTLEEQFMTKIEISDDWYGKKDKNVKLIRKIKSEDSISWATPGLPVRTFNLYDPEKMWDFLDSANHCLAGNDAVSVNECSAAAKNWVKEVNAHPSVTKTAKRSFYGVEIVAH